MELYGINKVNLHKVFFVVKELRSEEQNKKAMLEVAKASRKRVL
jgi:hypothetical protein